LHLTHILRKARNVVTILGEVTGFDTAARRVKFTMGAELDYDYLIVAAGARHAYFGHDEWAGEAPGLKTIEDAVEIRNRLLFAFERAEREALLSGMQQPLTFAVIGGGPTGVELAGAIADLDHLFADHAGRLPIVSGQPFDCGQIGALGVGGEVLEFHGPDHLLTQLGHVTPPGVWG
jgi:NADH dehydrogenase FAD-containing subunit